MEGETNLRLGICVDGYVTGSLFFFLVFEEVLKAVNTTIGC